VEEAVSLIRDLRPQQVMLETCSQRHMLSDRRAASGGSTSASPSEGPPLGHTDAIDIVNGGIRGKDLVELTRAAVDVGAQVYTVDRPYQETQNRIARCLVTRPRELLTFVRHAALALQAHADPISQAKPVAADGSLEQSCPGAHKVLCQEREDHIAREVAKRAVRGADVLVLCNAERLAGLQRLLHDLDDLLEAAADPVSSATRIWPFLLIIVYVLLPIYGSFFVAWRLSRLISQLLLDRVRPALTLEPQSEAVRPAEKPGVE